MAVRNQGIVLLRKEKKISLSAFSIVPPPPPPPPLLRGLLVHKIVYKLCHNGRELTSLSLSSSSPGEAKEKLLTTQCHRSIYKHTLGQRPMRGHKLFVKKLAISHA